MSLPVAGLGYRAMAYLIDALALFGGYIVVYFGFSLLVPDVLQAVLSLSTLQRAAGAAGAVLTTQVYWSVAEVVWRGQTLGKRLMHIRVVRADGSPVGFFESAVRNLLRLIDFLPGLYGVGLLVMMLDARHRRLGDVVAGTIVAREERIDLERYVLAGEAPSSLPTHELELVSEYLRRVGGLQPAARLAVGQKLVERLGGKASTEREVREFLERAVGGSRG